MVSFSSVLVVAVKYSVVSSILIYIEYRILDNSRDKISKKNHERLSTTEFEDMYYLYYLYVRSVGVGWIYDPSNM